MRIGILRFKVDLGRRLPRNNTIMVGLAIPDRLDNV